MRNIAENIFSRSGVIAFARAIGFADDPVELPANGTPAVTHLGSRGSSRCIHVSVADFEVTNLNRIARQLRLRFAAESLLLLITSADYARVCVACFSADDLCTLLLERGRLHDADVDALTELIPQNGEAGLQLAMRHARALDRLRVSNRFFNDFRAHRARVADAWEGIAPRFREERDQLALLLLSRLMFLYFLQRRGFLSGNPEFFLDHLRAHFSKAVAASFYRSVLRPLFFGVLNRRPEKRTRRAAALGELPYLNGGLFERHHLERRFPDLNIPDRVMRDVFEQLLERYRFTAVEGEQDLAVDPEMLGRVFEGLMAENTRQNTGTFYTPGPVVQRMVRSAFDAYLSTYPMHQTARLLRDVRVLDPACGSGAFLLGALNYISRRRCTIGSCDGGDVRNDVVARNLHGVDLQQDAALLCALRLWLALIPESAGSTVQPLPNLDRRIRQGDALVDPLDLAAEAIASAEVRAARRALQPLVERYTRCDPEERPGVHRLVARRERELSRAWLNALQLRARDQAREYRAQAASRDLFGAVPRSAIEARAQLSELEHRVTELRRLNHKLRENGALPFFSFNVHLADAEKSGFDVILCNPPWVRAHNWPKHITQSVRRRFYVCRDAGQVDLALVFLERAISLLSNDGVLAIVLPAKFLRSASAGAARELLLRRMDVLSIEDHSLDQRSIFGADAFAAIVIARKKGDDHQRDTSITMIRRGQTNLTFATRLRYDERDARSPWLLAPPAVRATIARMRESGRTIGEQLQIRRGVVTGANGALIVTHAEARLGDLAWIRGEAGAEAHVELSVLRPLIRGSNIDAWRSTPTDFIVFCHHDDSGAYLPPPRRAAHYLRSHGATDSKGRLGALQYVAGSLAVTRLAWHDLASTVKAVVLPPQTHCLGGQRPIVPLNTTYYIALPERDAFLLAAYFNSLPFRTYARAIAERAKDAHFRFFACTMGLLPLPADWRMIHADELIELSRSCHAAAAIEPSMQHQLDELIASAYGLSSAAMSGLRRFDQWLRGVNE